MLDAGKSLVVVGCVALGFIVSAGPGLVARAAEPERWVGTIAADVSKAADDAAQRRIVELERRVKELEAERHAGAGSSAKALAAVQARTEALEAHNRALSIENQELAHRAAVEAQSSTCGAPEGTDAKEQLRYWAQRLRDDERGFRGRMSSEWNAALNVVLRRDRPLDPRNPWRDQ